MTTEPHGGDKTVDQTTQIGRGDDKNFRKPFDTLEHTLTKILLIVVLFLNLQLRCKLHMHGHKRKSGQSVRYKAFNSMYIKESYVTKRFRQASNFLAVNLK